MSNHGEAVYATLLLSDNYLPGALVLAHSLRDNGTKAKLVALVALDTLSRTTIDELKNVYDDLIPITRIVNKTPANLYLMDRPDLISTFTKIELWKQTQYKQIVYIDCDVVALSAPDELLTRDTNFSAVPDIGWPDCFNSGVMVLRPNMGDYYSLLALAQRGISFDGADQGLLNMHFRNWDRLSFTYNCTPSGNYQYVPAYRHFQSSINLVHFIGPDKPWFQGRDAGKASGVYDELLGRWWATYDRHYRAPLDLATAAYSGQAQSSSAIHHPDVTKHVFGEYVAPPAITYGYSSTQPSQSEPREQSVQKDTREHHSLNQRSSPSPAAAPAPPAPAPKPFSPPLSEWNAARAPPPPGSKPEALNFPSKVYNMSNDRKLFQPPQSYPEAPKDMWYQVPPKSPAKAKPDPIFPWEAKAPKATRVFPPSPKPEQAPEPSTPTQQTSGESKSGSETPTTPTISVTSSDPWSSYSNVNAWDNVPEIQRYMQAVQRSRNRRSVQLVPVDSGEEEVLSPGEGPVPIKARTERRESLILTDFPTKTERPSLPVTPAPIRRPNFWGNEGDASGADAASKGRQSISSLPPAEGVPSQAEWNPSVQLEELQRRQSAVLLERLASLDQTNTTSNTATTTSEKTSGTASPATTTIPSEAATSEEKPVLRAPDFGGPLPERTAKVEEAGAGDKAPEDK